MSDAHRVLWWQLLSYSSKMGVLKSRQIMGVAWTRGPLPLHSPPVTWRQRPRTAAPRYSSSALELDVFIMPTLSVPGLRSPIKPQSSRTGSLSTVAVTQCACVISIIFYNYSGEGESIQSVPPLDQVTWNIQRGDTWSLYSNTSLRNSGNLRGCSRYKG